MITVVDAKDLSAFSASFQALSNLSWKPKMKSVFIKPNVGATSKTVNTDPEIVRGIIRYLRKNFGIEDITIGEGSVQTEYESTFYNFKYCSWDKLADEEDVTLIDLNKEKRTEISWHYGKIKIPKILFGKSYINVAKMKTHMQTLVSLCIKNQKGLLDSETRKTIHKLGLHEPIAKLSDIIKPEICLVDGIVGIEGNAPGDLGKTKKVGLIVAGDKMVDVDRICCRIMGIDPDQVEHIRLASDAKGVLLSYEESKQLWSYLGAHQFKLPSNEFKMFNVHMRPENACTACMSSIGKLNKLARRSLQGITYFIRNGILNRLDIVIGNPQELPNGHGKIIFYGNCTSHIAKQHPNYQWIEGCPPNSKRALGLLSK